MPATATHQHNPTRQKTGPKTLTIDWNLYDKQIAAGKTKTEIARNMGLTPQSLGNRVKRRGDILQANPLISDPIALENFKKNRADILADVQRKIVEAITPEKIEKASLGTLALAKCQLYDKERLERGLSTGNLSVFGHIIGEANQAIAAGDL